MTLRFGTDGVRGVANQELTPELVLALGRAAAAVLGSAAPFAVGRDPRRSGPMLEAALVAGLTAAGASVELLGVVPTPAVARRAATEGAPGAVVSASHNPYSDNGVKFFAAGGRKLRGAEESAIEAAWHAPAPLPPAEPGSVAVVADAGARYADEVVAAFPEGFLRGRRIALDTANGAASETAPRALRALGADVVCCHDTPDGTNINAGCGSTQPDDLRALVASGGFDAGLAFDGDADRVIAVDEHGGLVDGDRILATLAIDRHRRGALPNDAVAITVMSNLGLRRALEAEGIGVVETPVGDRFVLDALDAHGLALGGEQSGHVILGDLATTGDGLLTGLALLDVVVRTGRPLSELAAVVEPYPQVLRNVPAAPAAIEPGTPFWDTVRRVEGQLGSAGRVVVRPSGTEPVVRVMVEAETPARAEAAASELVNALRGPGS